MEDPKKEQVEIQENNNDKASQKFEVTFKKVVALFQGEEKLKGKRKIPKNDVGLIIDEILKEGKEEKIKDFKVKAGELIGKYVQFKKDCDEAEKLYKKTVIDKKIEYTKAMENVLSIIEDVDTLEKDYYAALQDVKTN